MGFALKTVSVTAIPAMEGNSAKKSWNSIVLLSLRTLKQTRLGHHATIMGFAVMECAFAFQDLKEMTVENMNSANIIAA